MKMRQHFLRRVAALVLVATAVAPVAHAKKLNMDEQLVAVTDVIATFSDIPERAIPPALLKRAHAIVVIPDMVKFGFVVAGRHGKGIMSVRQGNEWSAPLFVSLTGGSVGWQAGLQSSDVVLIFTNRAGVENITRGKFTLGADASIAAGPIGRHGSAATDKTLNAEVYSYSRSRGLFAGVSVDGARLAIDKKANAAFYVSPTISALDIVSGKIDTLPDSARKFTRQLPDLLNGAAPADSEKGDSDSETTDQPNDNGSTPQPVKTYPIGERAATGGVEPSDATQ